MPSHSLIAHLKEIRDHTDLAFLFIGNSTIGQFIADTKTVYAVTRCLEIAFEASRKLPPELKARHSHISWEGMTEAGYMYRHRYERVLNRDVWEATQDSLKPLLAVVEEELRRLDAG